ncbi:sialate O-acetylesterase, partial [bacterium]|nr:sialate O-acetylesterase [bacterium]
PAVLYNEMIHPIIPFSCRGVIWYQGEANVDRPIQYRKLFPALIKNWRQEWGQGDFPFYFVQIAPYFQSVALAPCRSQLSSVHHPRLRVPADRANARTRYLVHYGLTRKSS